MVRWPRPKGIVGELYDVAVLPGIRRPAARGFKSDEIRRVIAVGASPQTQPAAGRRDSFIGHSL